MKYHALLMASVIASLTVFSTCYGHEETEGSASAPIGAETQKPDGSATIPADTGDQKPVASETGDDKPDVQKQGSSTATAGAEPQKPGEDESLKAAVAYVNRDGGMIVIKSEFIAWGTYNEKLVYWPMKLRITYKNKGSDAQRQNYYAVKISRDEGKLQAGPYYAWRTDFNN